MKTVVASTIRGIFNSSDIERAQLALSEAVSEYSTSAPKLATRTEVNLPEDFTIFSPPEPLRKRLRTSNMCEALNSSIKRKTRVVGLFPSEAALERPVTAVLMEMSEGWETGKIYLTLTSNN